MAGAAPTAESARRCLAAIARAPRPAGGESEREARAWCARELGDLGFSVLEEPFDYSALPGRVGTPVAGAISMVTLAAAGHLGWRGGAGAALALLLAVAIPAAVAARWLARRGVLGAPWMRQRAANLEATRGAPAVWLVAHLDSKSQPVPIGVRALGIVLSGLAWLAALAVAILQLAGHEVAWMWPAISALGVLGGAPVAASVVRERSPGALDNASGVATVLLAAAAAPRTLPLGVLVTSAEELGLAGARAWVRGRRPGVAVNVDGVDDAGGTRLMWTGGRPARLVEALLRAGGGRGIGVTGSRLLPGILTDGVALADAGWAVVTVSRGTIRTVARIHTPRDSAAELHGDGIAATAAMIADALPELSRMEPS